MATPASMLEGVNPRSTVEQFDKEFQRYTSKHVRGTCTNRASTLNFSL